MRAHFEDYQSNHVTPDVVLDEAVKFSKMWALRYLRDKTELAAPDLPTLSGCSEATVNSGGLRGFT